MNKRNFIYFLILSIALFSCGDSQTDQAHSNPTASSTESEPDPRVNLIEDPSISLPGTDQISTAYRDYLVGKINYRKDSGFVLVAPEHSSKELYLRTQTYRAFISMYEAAKQEGIKLTIISGARNFEHQKSIWEKKWKNSEQLPPKERALEILKYSSMPMSSRHHWGTDFDLNSLENDYFKSGEGLKIYTWLQENAGKYGFCQVYSDKAMEGRKGYEMEKWHWSYMPLASEILARYNQEISSKDIQGFLGSEVASEINLIEDFVNGIDACGY